MYDISNIVPSQSFLYEDDQISFVADPGDIRSTTIFFDEGAQQWCAGVTVRENYSKIRFAGKAPARQFARFLHAAKNAELARLTHNSVLRDAKSVVKAG